MRSASSALAIRAVNSSPPGTMSAGKRWTSWPSRLGWIGKKEEFNRLAQEQIRRAGAGWIGVVHSGGSEKLLLLKPTTFMNDSGRSVQAAMAFYQLSPADLMVVLDDLALPCGKIRIRPGGSSRRPQRAEGYRAGDGHGCNIRGCGSGSTPRRRECRDRDYVLGRFTDEQRRAVDPAMIGRRRRS